MANLEGAIYKGWAIAAIGDTSCSVRYYVQAGGFNPEGYDTIADAKAAIDFKEM